MNTWPETAGCLCARMSRGFNGQDAMGLLVVITSPGKQSAVCGCKDGRRKMTVYNYSGGGIAGTLDASYYKGPGERMGTEREFVAIENEKPNRKYIVRRLTPTECARLQGFPDWWTDGANGSDSAQYKLWGNGIALPCAADVLGRIAEELSK